jgi:Ca-activated chloride channel family protein
MRMKALMLCALLLPAPATADCRLALALGMDVSRSVDRADFAVQTEGLALALEDEAVRQAFFAPAGDVALAVYFWSGERQQDLVVDWVVVQTAQELEAVAAAVRAQVWPEVRQLTALGEALDYGRRLLEQGPDCRRHVIDLAGDGQNNQGRAPHRVYDAGGWEGITVNALAIRSHELGLVRYYTDHVMRGPGAFVEVAETQAQFPATIRRKLVRELTEAFAALPAGADRPVSLFR